MKFWNVETIFKSFDFTFKCWGLNLMPHVGQHCKLSYHPIPRQYLKNKKPHKTMFLKSLVENKQSNDNFKYIYTLLSMDELKRKAHRPLYYTNSIGKMLQYCLQGTQVGPHSLLAHWTEGISWRNSSVHEV